MNQKAHDDIRQNVRENYTEVAEASNSGDCCGVESSCCGVSNDTAINTLISTGNELTSYFGADRG